MMEQLRSLGLEDRNGDGIPDYLNTRIYVPEDPSSEEIAAAANIAARLAFETTSMDLPIGFPISAYRPGSGIAILVGRAAARSLRSSDIIFPNTDDAEAFARSIGIEAYAEAGPPSRAAATAFTLADLVSAVRQIVIGPDVRDTAVIDLAARIGLESTELRLPLVRVENRQLNAVPQQGTIVVGLSNTLVQQLIRTGRCSPPREGGTGCITLCGEVAIIAGADPSGEQTALRHATLCMPYLWKYGKGQASLASVEEEVRRHCFSDEPKPELMFEDTYELEWEVDDVRRRIRESLLPLVEPGDKVEVDLRLSEPLEIRLNLAKEIEKAIPGSSIRILCAHKQGFSWLDEEIKPLLKEATRIQIRFRELTSGSDSLDTPDRWLQELYPVDEILARDLGVPLDNISFERVRTDAEHIYEVLAEGVSGNAIAKTSFDPTFVIRPLFDIFPDYANALVATGWLKATVNGTVVINERVKTDYERFWDEYQGSALPKIRDYVLSLHSGKPAPHRAPHFDELSVDVQLSEPDFRIGIDQERISTLEALHEDIYFETLLFFDILGKTTCGQPLRYPGRIVPRIKLSRQGKGEAHVRFTGYSKPFQQDRPFANSNPAVTSVRVRAGHGVTAIEVTADTQFSWLLEKPEEDAIVSQRSLRRPVVPWDEPIGPEACEEIVRQLGSFPEVHPFVAGRSWLGRPVWAMNVLASFDGKYFSERKASVTKPCLFVTGRQHANEVSSTSHVLRLVELLATDTKVRELLKRVNFIIQPMTNPDGAGLVDELHRTTPDFMLHAGYLGALGVDVTEDQWSKTPRYPEARVRTKLWSLWQPDVVLNPHGYPSHEWVQLFAGYTAWVRSKDMQARDWWIPRGWFMPRFDFVEDERFPNHRRAALMLRDRISEAIRSRMGSVNERMYRRYAKYTRCNLDLHDGVLIQCHEKGSRADPNSFGFMTRHPEITFFEGLSEAPDEVASGDWLETLAAAGLEFSLVHARFLAELPDGVIRTRRKEERTDVFRVSRTRLPLR